MTLSMGRLSRRVFLGGAAVPLLGGRRGPGRGFRVASAVTALRDTLTERKLFRLTEPSVLHHLPHYHHRFIARDNSFILLASERSGNRQIYRLDLPEGKMVQLTEGPGVHSYSPALDPGRRAFFYLQNDTLKRAAVHGRSERRIYESDLGWRMSGHLSVSDKGRYVAVVEMKVGHRVAGFEEQFQRRPRCRIRVVETARRRSWVAVETSHWLAHPQFQPGGTDILYSHEGPWDEVEGRLRLVRLDGSYRKNIRSREGSEALGHEHWSSSGKEICFVFYPDASGPRAAVHCIHIDSGRERTLADCSQFAWMSPNADDSVFVGASRRVAGPNIYLLFPLLKREVTIAEHLSTLKPYPIAGRRRLDPFTAWPEPVFSPDSQWMYFVTDREGKPAIYRMDLSDLVEKTAATLRASAAERCLRIDRVGHDALKAAGLALGC